MLVDALSSRVARDAGFLRFLRRRTCPRFCLSLDFLRRSFECRSTQVGAPRLAGQSQKHFQLVEVASLRFSDVEQSSAPRKPPVQHAHRGIGRHDLLHSGSEPAFLRQRKAWRRSFEPPRPASSTYRYANRFFATHQSSTNSLSMAQITGPGQRRGGHSLCETKDAQLRGANVHSPHCRD